MNFITFSDLYIYYYLHNEILTGVSVGNSSTFILANLSSFYNTKIIGLTGSDIQSKIVLNDLKRLNIGTSLVKQEDRSTSCLFISNKQSTTCPYCNRTYSNDINLDELYILDNIRPLDNIILDNLDDFTISLLPALSNDIYLDLGFIGNLRYKSLEELKDLNGKFKVINMDVKVYTYLRDKFKIDYMDIYNIFNPSILIIYKGIHGADFIYDDIFDDKTVIDKTLVVDSTGSRETFFATFIHLYISNNYKLDDKFISESFISSFAESLYVSSLVGGLTHLIPLNKVINYKECICKDIEVNI